MSRWMRQQRKRARRARHRDEVEAQANAEKESRRYAPVMMRMMKILTVDTSVKFGAALTRAAKELGVRIPQHIEAAMLKTAFKLVVRA